MEFSNIYSKSNIVNVFESEIRQVWVEIYGMIAYAEKEPALVTVKLLQISILKWCGQCRCYYTAVQSKMAQKLSYSSPFSKQTGDHKKQHVLAMRDVFFPQSFACSVSALFWGEKDNFGESHVHMHTNPDIACLKKSLEI